MEALSVGRPAKRRARVPRSARASAKPAAAAEELDEAAAAASALVVVPGAVAATDADDVAARLAVLQTEVDKLKSKHG